MDRDISFPDLPELLYQRRISVDTDTMPAFHVKFGRIGFLDGVIAADVHIEPGPLFLAENTLQKKVFTAHRVRQSEAFHLDFFHELTDHEMQPGVAEGINDLITKRHDT